MTAQVAQVDLKATALHRAFLAQKTDVERFLTRLAGKRGVMGEYARDEACEAIVAAYEKEARGDSYDPEKENVKFFFGRCLLDRLAEERRKQRKGRTLRVEEAPEGHQAADEGPTPEILLIETYEEDRLHTLVHTYMAAKTRTGFILKVLDTMRDGYRKHADIAEKLECELSKVRNAVRRIYERASEIASMERTRREKGE